ncbi:hypothetical protein OAS39_11365 [Pirellulales bacterium]|nr:hypothetical protein [Pirellulales bacterium]
MGRKSMLHNDFHPPNPVMAQFEIIRDGTNSDYNANHWDFDGFPGRPPDSGNDEYGRIPGGGQ